MEIRDSNYVDKDGNEKSSYGKWENGQFKYTDGRETSADDKTTNGNGSSTAPGSNVKMMVIQIQKTLLVRPILMHQRQNL